MLCGVVLSVAGVLSFAAKAEASHAQGPYSIDVLVEGVPQPSLVSGGQTFVVGVLGASYEVRVHNQSGRRIEALVAVDGRDVITGQPIDPRSHRGYLVSPWDTVSIDGFRSSSSSVATFRFSTIPRSYAWRTGTAWGIGTIRAWVFEEAAPPLVRPRMLPYGGDDGFGQPPTSGDSRAGSAPSASAPRDMGTEYGEQRWSPVGYTVFRRQSGHANAILGVRYQSRDALIAAGILHPTWYEPPYPYEPSYPYAPFPVWYSPRPYPPPPPGYPY